MILLSVSNLSLLDIFIIFIAIPIAGILILKLFIEKFEKYWHKKDDDV